MKFSKNALSVPLMSFLPFISLRNLKQTKGSVSFKPPKNEI